jgi:hypothetical protein
MSYNLCKETCKRLDVSCPNSKCKYYIDYEEELNCSLVSIERNGPMTLREVADRLNLSFVRVQQIEERILSKAKEQFNEEDYLL